MGACFWVFVMALAGLPWAVTAQRGKVERSQVGDTTVVRTTGNGVWGPARAPTEIKRIAGESEETTFGDVLSLVATAEGGVIAFDRKAIRGPVIRRFDAEGKFVGNLSRQGGGPGEFRV